MKNYYGKLHELVQLLFHSFAPLFSSFIVFVYRQSAEVERAVSHLGTKLRDQDINHLTSKHFEETEVNSVSPYISALGDALIACRHIITAFMQFIAAGTGRCTTIRIVLWLAILIRFLTYRYCFHALLACPDVWNSTHAFPDWSGG